MTMFKRILLVLALMMLLVMPASAQEGSAMTVSWPQEPDSLNPMYTTMTFAGYTIQLYLSGAWNFDANDEPNPVLVSEIPSFENGGISEDGTVFTLNLREGMTWSDGEALDSEDFVFTYEMYISESNTPLSVSPYDRIASVEAPDATTVVVTFDEPFAGWFSLFSYVLPEHVLRPVFEEEGTLDNAAFNRSPMVSSGPYVFETWDTGNFMRFTPNPNFVAGEAQIETVVVTFIPDDETYLASLISGESQLGTFIPLNEVGTVEEAGINVDIIPSGYNEGWFLNASEELAHPAMSDVRVREAIAHGFNRYAVVEDLLEGGSEAVGSYWAGTPYTSPNVGPVPYDPEYAASLLEEAGWVDTDGDGIREKDGETLTLRIASTTRQLRQDIMAVAQQQLGEIGIEIIIEAYESNVFFNGYAEGGPAATGNYDIAEWSSSPDSFPDPSTFRFTCDEIPSDDSPSGGNWNYYCNPELDALFEEQATTIDTQERIAIFHEIDEMLYDAFIWLGIYADADVWVVNPAIENANINGSTPFWDVTSWTVSSS